MDDTTTPDVQGDAGHDDWQARYQGLQKVLSARDRELAAAQTERDKLKADREAAEADLVELSEFRKAREAAEAEAKERAEYEALRAKFEAAEPEPPNPTPHNESRGPWSGPDYPAKGKSTAEPSGFPI